jgi:hypothetical protein
VRRSFSRRDVVDGAEQFFGSQIDFGYSKSREETLTIWNKEAALREAVAVIRQFRPDIVVTRFSPDERGTHGHHTTSALLAVEACTAAADPARFPDLLDASEPWRVTRVVWNWFNLGDGPWPPEQEDFLAIDVGGYDALLGESYPEMAGRSLTMHKTQGFGSAGPRGSVVEHFRMLAGEPFRASLFDGIDRTWRRVPGAADLTDYSSVASVSTRARGAATSVPSFSRRSPHSTRCLTIRGRRTSAKRCVKPRGLRGHPPLRARRRGTGRPQPQSAAGERDPALADRRFGSRDPPTRGSIAGARRGRFTRAQRPAGNRRGYRLPDVHGEADVGVELDLAIGDRVPYLAAGDPPWIDPVIGERWEPVTIVPPSQSIRSCRC